MIGSSQSEATLDFDVGSAHAPIEIDTAA